ncbi:MAG: LysM peptidoglycan-binding domain-containing M23 family metallopeptidase [Rhodovibrionaceae bacterium]
MRLAVLAPLLFLLAACGSSGGYIPKQTPPAAPELPAPNPFRDGSTALQPVASPTAVAGTGDPNLNIVEGGGYMVRRGDTVFGIARQFEVPLRSVIDANGLQPPYTLRIGQNLKIPSQRVHTVEAGNTVYGISRTYGVDLSELVRLNGIAEPYAITVGQRLVLPTASDVQTASAAPRVSAASPDLDAEEPATTPVSVPTAPATAASAPTAAQGAPAAIPTPPARSGGKFAWPLQGPTISLYGPTADGLHNDGINIEALAGTPILAAENGVVAYAGNELRGFGNLLLIKHADGWVTAYAHTETFLVEPGQSVTQGQQIATVGRSGNVDRPQLHFEIRKGSRAIDPREMLGPQSSNAN